MPVYPIREDTLLIKRNLKGEDLEGKKFLEIGVGNGELSITAAKRGAYVTGVDIDEEALKYTQERFENSYIDAEIFKSNLFDEIKAEFDFIVFNPPYLPGKDGIGDENMWRGGKNGLETSKEYLNQVKDYLKEKGIAWIVLSSKTSHSKPTEEYNMKMIDSKKLWFETIYLYELE